MKPNQDSLQEGSAGGWTPDAGHYKVALRCGVAAHLARSLDPWNILSSHKRAASPNLSH